ncbi:unnamed protein product, partial [Adineta ricciae]
MFSTKFSSTSSRVNQNTFNPHGVNESILNHLFLPYRLPSSASKDYLTQHDHQNEYKLLECTHEYLKSIDAKNDLPIFSTLKTCIERWSSVQSTMNCSVSLLQATIQKLAPGEFLPLYFHAQNAAILIEIDKNSPNQPLISSWQVLLPTETITSSLEPHFSCFPVPVFRLPDRTQLISTVQCELLSEFMNNTIEYPKSHKASYTFDEIREVPTAHYVCHWWVTQFQGVQADSPSNPPLSFKKKHRDQIRYKTATYPFRRSGLWMTMKVVLQNILTKCLGDIGIIVYKLLVTDFLTYFICTKQYQTDYQLSTDLLMFCLRKIVRRLSKIETLLSSIDSNDIIPWAQSMLANIKEKIDRITPKSDWQKSIEENQKENTLQYQLNLNQTILYRHPCMKLNTYLDRLHSGISSRHVYNRVGYSLGLSSNVTNGNDVLPLFSVLIKHEPDAMEITLARIEMWVEFHLEKWINRSLLSRTGYKCFEDLQAFYEEYQNAALSFYSSNNESTDLFGYGRFILTSLTIIHLMHVKLCAAPRFKRLRDHAIIIPNLLNLFEFLILPSRDDMIRARYLYDYFSEFNCKSYPDILSNIDSENAFGVDFANQSEEINENLKKIAEQAAQDQNDKLREVHNAKESYERLMKTANRLECECELLISFQKCRRCTTITQANNMKLDIYECPISYERKSALAVMFELQMPSEFRCYRDILWQFVNRPNPTPAHKMHEWLSTRPHKSKLRDYFKSSPNYKVKLVSETKSISESHYSNGRCIASTPVEEYFYKNSLKVQISPTKPCEFQDECRALTPNLTDSNYKDLQFSLRSTAFVQNQVIAELSKCSLKLNPNEFVEFGSFRSGHRLQWWNLLSILELDSLAMDEESVVILITHALLQYGPVARNPQLLTHSWCPESHEQILDDLFVDELILRLDRHLKDCECNWQNEFMLVIITIITMRIFTICNSTRKDQMMKLVMKCRQIGVKWIDLISKSIQHGSVSDFDSTNALREKIIVIGITYLLTFAIYIDSSNTLELTNSDIVSLLVIATTMHDNSILNKDTIKISVFMRNLRYYGEYILLRIHPSMSKLIQESSYESLNNFCTIHWTVARTKGTINGKWKKRNGDAHDGWYDGEYESNKLSIDCIRGRFLVNGMTIGFLPDKITSNDLFRRVFRQHVFEVQAAETQDSYITKHAYHNHDVDYEFTCDYTQGVMVYEHHLKANKKFQLLPTSCFEEELPDVFVSNYSHWRDADTDEVEFRPIYFQDANFLTEKHYILRMKEGLITTKYFENEQILINRTSSCFRSLFTRYFTRLDEEPYVYMLGENNLIHIHLSRLGIVFKYDLNQNIITSREYSDMYVDENQWFGTLTGLQFGLLLSPIAAVNQKQTHYSSRKLIVPFGQIQATKNSTNDHQTITIDRQSPPASMLHQYFVFVLNDRLRILQPTDSP